MRGSSAFRLRALVAGLVLVALGAAVPAPARAAVTPPPAAAPAPVAPAPALRVAGTAIVDAAGDPVVLRGVNRSGSQYLCQQRKGFFDGGVDQSAIDLLRSWSITMVRIPLNEHCWLGVADNPTWTGEPYRAAISGYVARLEANGITPVLDLHYTSADSDTAVQRNEMPDERWSLPFWTSVATRFVHDRAVVFEPYNEPHDVSVSCWLDGCTMPAGWRAAGYQQLVDTIRATGATQPIVVNGLNWGHDMSTLTAAMPVDPAGALVAGQHLYNFKSCVTAACWSAQFAPAAARWPMIATEVGVNDCSTAMPLAFLAWMAANGGDGVAFWNFGVTGCPDGGGRTGGSALITSASGTPSAYGQAVHDAFTATSPPPCDGDRYAGTFRAASADGSPTGPVLATSCEDLVQHAWGSRAPVAGVPADGFSAVWTRTVRLAGGAYTFGVTSDDGMRVLVDGVPVLDDWTDHATRARSVTVPLAAGTHVYRIEYHDTTGNATARFTWTRSG